MRNAAKNGFKCSIHSRSKASFVSVIQACSPPPPTPLPVMYDLRPPPPASFPPTLPARGLRVRDASRSGTAAYPAGVVQVLIMVGEARVDLLLGDAR